MLPKLDLGSYPSRHCNSDLFLTNTGICHLSLQLLEFGAYPSKYWNSPISAETVTGHFPSFSAVAPSDVGDFLGEQSVKFFQQYVWQFQRGLFHDTPTSTSTGCCSSFLAGSVTETSFLLYLFVHWYSHGSSCFSATLPSFVGTILIWFLLGTINQQPDLGAFGRESVHSWPRLRANPRENWWPKSLVALLVAPAKKRVVEITDILTLIQTFTI